MSPETSQSLYLSLEDFFLVHAQRLHPLIGERAAQYAWALKDMDPRSPEGEAACRRAQEALARALDGRPAQWVTMVSESHQTLSLEEWIGDILKNSVAHAETVRTGHGDLDLNVETQLNCGMQLEAFHSGDWAKAKLTRLFEPETFEALDPLICRFDTPLPHAIDRLDRDLDIAIKGGMRHRYQCSVGVGSICLRIGTVEGGDQELIPVVRRAQVSNVAGVVSLMTDELKERFKALNATINEQQGNLRLLPEGWPDEHTWATMKQWQFKRFVGDNGLVGSDFFEGRWVAAELPHDVHRKVCDSGPAPLDALSVAERVALRRAGASPPPSERKADLPRL